MFSDTDLPRNFQSFRTLQRAFLVLRNISSQLDKRKQVDRRKLFRLKLISSCKRIMLLALQNCNFFLSPFHSLISLNFSFHATNFYNNLLRYLLSQTIYWIMICISGKFIRIKYEKTLRMLIMCPNAIQ